MVALFIYQAEAPAGTKMHDIQESPPVNVTVMSTMILITIQGFILIIIHKVYKSYKILLSPHNVHHMYNVLYLSSSIIDECNNLVILNLESALQ